MKYFLVLKEYSLLLVIILLMSFSCKTEESSTLPVLETLDITQITQNTAKSGGNIVSDGGTEIIARGICWNIEATPTTKNSKTIDGKGVGSFESTLSGLHATTKYYLRAYATNLIGTSYGSEGTFTTESFVSPINGQIVADHTIVDRFDDIPAEYMTAVKKMWLCYSGESHAVGIAQGFIDLEALYPTHNANVTTSGTPETYTDQYLRVCKATWGNRIYPSGGWQYQYGESTWFTNTTGIGIVKSGLLYTKNTGPQMTAFGFGWCWDMTQITDEGPPTTNADPILGVHWYGMSREGPEGDKPWGLEDADFTETANSVNLDSYLEATQSYIDYCTANSINTKVFFTTGVVDQYTGESGYQSYLKNERIRDYVDAHGTTILFDYADILCYNDSGVLHTETWSGHTYPLIHPDNETGEISGHIGINGRIRLAKALWWMLARMAGWDGV